MSSPSGKPFDPFDLSPYAPKRARERSSLERPPVDSDGSDGDDNAQHGGEESAAPLPRAVQLPPVSGLRPVGEQFINGVRVPPSLAPERLRPPPPMRERRDNLRGPLRVLLATAIAAPIAYYFSVGNLAPTSESGRESRLASFASRLVASSEFPIPKEKLRPSEAEDYNTVISSRNKLVVQPTIASQSATSASAETAAAVAPSPVTEQAAAPASKTIRELDPESIKLLMQ